MVFRNRQRWFCFEPRALWFQLMCGWGLVVRHHRITGHLLETQLGSSTGSKGQGSRTITTPPQESHRYVCVTSVCFPADSPHDCVYVGAFSGTSLLITMDPSSQRRYRLPMQQRVWRHPLMSSQPPLDHCSHHLVLQRRVLPWILP